MWMDDFISFPRNDKRSVVRADQLHPVFPLERAGCLVTACSAPVRHDATRDLVEDARGVSQFCPGARFWSFRHGILSNHADLRRRGTVISVGGPMFVQYIRPSEEELFKVSDDHPGTLGHVTQCVRMQSQSLLVFCVLLLKKKIRVRISVANCSSLC